MSNRRDSDSKVKRQTTASQGDVRFHIQHDFGIRKAPDLRYKSYTKEERQVDAYTAEVTFTG